MSHPLTLRCPQLADAGSLMRPIVSPCVTTHPLRPETGGVGGVTYTDEMIDSQFNQYTFNSLKDLQNFTKKKNKERKIYQNEKKKGEKKKLLQVSLSLPPPAGIQFPSLFSMFEASDCNSSIYSSNCRGTHSTLNSHNIFTTPSPSSPGYYWNSKMKWVGNNETMKRSGWKTISGR